MTSYCYYKTVHATLCLTYCSTALTQCTKHTQDPGKNNSWIHFWIFIKEECLLLPLWAAVQVLMWQYEPSTPPLVQNIGTMYSISHTQTHCISLCKAEKCLIFLNLWIFKKLELRIKVNIVQVLRWEYFGVVAQCQNTFSRCFPCDLSRDILCLLTLCRFILSNGTPVSPTPKNPWILRASPKRDYSGIHWYVAYWLPWHQDK